MQEERDLDGYQGEGEGSGQAQYQEGEEEVKNLDKIEI